MRLDQPLVSILIPVFNRVDFIEECVLSALNQTYENIEIIISDNQSNDGTWEKCIALSASYSNIKVIRNEENIGPFRNWMVCANEANGTYGKFLFSDDLMDRYYLEKLIPIFKDDSVGCVYSSVLIGRTLNESKLHYRRQDSLYKWSPKPYLINTVLGYCPFPVSPGAAIFCLSSIRDDLHEILQNEFPPCVARTGAGPDLYLYLATLGRGKSILAYPEALCFFRSHSDSISIKNTNNDVVNGYRVVTAWYLKRNNKRLWGLKAIFSILSHLKKNGIKGVGGVFSSVGIVVNLSDVIYLTYTPFYYIYALVYLKLFLVCEKNRSSAE